MTAAAPDRQDNDAFARMDRMYAPQRHIYDLTRKYYLLGRDRLIARLPVAPGDCVLEIGCGTGRNLIALARKHPGVRLFGLDASAPMLATAEAKLRRARLARRVRLERGLAEQFDAATLFGVAGGFDAIVISYALTMIPPWREVLDRATDQLRPGGVLAVVDFWDQGGLPRWFARLLQAWLRRFDVIPRPELPAYLEALGRARGAHVAIEPVRGRYALLATYTAAADAPASRAAAQLSLDIAPVA